MTAFTLDEAQRNLPEAVRKALQGEQVAITVGSEVVRLVQDIPLRPAGYFAECYSEAEDAAFEERICRDSKASLEE